jgi:hypothetical protein
MATMGILHYREKNSMVEPEIEPETSSLVVKNDDHLTTKLVIYMYT